MTLLLHLDPGSDPLRGWVGAEGREVEFVGWLALARELERALGDEHRSGAVDAEK